MAEIKLINGLKQVGQVLFLIVYAVYSYAYLFFRMIVPPAMKSLDGETFLITGSSSGIGKEVVLHLARYHPKTKLVLWDFNAELNRQIAKEAKSFGATVFTYEVDVTDRDRVEDTARKVQREVGDVTILFNNAGIAKIGDFFEQPAEDLEKVMQVNLISHFWTLRAFMPKMIDNNHGHIITTCSMGGYIAMRHSLPYFAAKFGIRGYIESLQDELYFHPKNPNKIKFTTVFPAFVETPMTTKVKLQDGSGNEHRFMKADFVAKKIVEGVRQNQERILLPTGIELVVLMKSLMPNSLFAKITRTFVQDGRTDD